jgi:chemotaxis protein histidine kinase CheA
VPRDPLLVIYEYLKGQDDDSLGDSLRLIRNSLFLSMQNLLQNLCKEVEPLALELGKAVPEFCLDLPDLWVSRPIEELLRNCLVHLLRNSLDHGLQAPAERQSRGLTPQGRISITASIRGGMIDFILEDDGRGLNLKKLRDIGLQRGLLNIKSADDPKTLALLIFHPDLSTAERVSDLSGRGIGMTTAALTKDTPLLPL